MLLYAMIPSADYVSHCELTQHKAEILQEKSFKTHKKVISHKHAVLLLSEQTPLKPST